MSVHINLTRRIGLWGLPSSGKTVWLASLTSCSRDHALKIPYAATSADQECQVIIEKWRSTLCEDRQWPAFTRREHHKHAPELTLDFRSEELQRTIVTADFAGEWTSGASTLKELELDEHQRQQILEFVQTSDMIMVMIPYYNSEGTSFHSDTRTRSSLDILIKALEGVHSNGQRLTKPIALCVTCWDRSSHTLSAPDIEEERATKWVKENYGPSYDALSAVCHQDTLRIFPVSSTGHGERIPDSVGEVGSPPETLKPFNTIAPLTWAIPLDETNRLLSIQNQYQSKKAQIHAQRQSDGKTHAAYIIERLDREIIQRLPKDDQRRGEAEGLKSAVLEITRKRRKVFFNTIISSATLVVLIVLAVRWYVIREHHGAQHEELHQQIETTLTEPTIDELVVLEKISNQTIAAYPNASGEITDRTLTLLKELRERKTQIADKLAYDAYGKLEDGLRRLPIPEKPTAKDLPVLDERLKLLQQFKKLHSHSSKVADVDNELALTAVAINDVKIKESERKQAEEDQSIFKDWKDLVNSLTDQSLANLEKRIEYHQDYLERISAPDLKERISTALREDRKSLITAHAKAKQESQQSHFAQWKVAIGGIHPTSTTAVDQRIEIHEQYLKIITEDNLKEQIQVQIHEDQKKRFELDEKTRFDKALEKLERSIKSQNTRNRVTTYDTFLREWGGNKNIPSDQIRYLRKVRDALLLQADKAAYQSVLEAQESGDFRRTLEAINKYKEDAAYTKHKQEMNALEVQIRRDEDKRLYNKLKDMVKPYMSEAQYKAAYDQAQVYINSKHFADNDKRKIDKVKKWVTEYRRLSDERTVHKVTISEIRVDAKNNGPLDDFWDATGPEVTVVIKTDRGKASSKNAFEISFGGQSIPISDGTLEWSWGNDVTVELTSHYMWDEEFSFEPIAGSVPFRTLTTRTSAKINGKTSQDLVVSFKTNPLIPDILDEYPEELQ